MVNKLNLDDSIFSIDWELLGFALLLAVFQEHVYHFVLDSLLHALDNHLSALFYLLLYGFLHVEIISRQLQQQLIPQPPLKYIFNTCNCIAVSSPWFRKINPNAVNFYYYRENYDTVFLKKGDFSIYRIKTGILLFILYISHQKH